MGEHFLIFNGFNTPVLCVQSVLNWYLLLAIIILERDGRKELMQTLEFFFFFSFFKKYTYEDTFICQTRDKTIKSEDSNYISSNIFCLKEALFEIKYHSAFAQYSSKYIKGVVNLLICNMILTAYCDCGDLIKVNEGKAINRVSRIWFVLLLLVLL